MMIGVLGESSLILIYSLIKYSMHILSALSHIKKLGTVTNMEYLVTSNNRNRYYSRSCTVINKVYIEICSVSLES